MTGYEYIVARQILWAQRRGIRLGSQYRNHRDPAKPQRGSKFVVFNLEDSLFGPPTDAARRAFEDGDGGEIRRDKPGEGNMYALHSSSAAAFNLFHHWHARNEFAHITSALGLPSAGATELSFESNIRSRPRINGSQDHPISISRSRTTDQVSARRRSSASSQSRTGDVTVRSPRHISSSVRSGRRCPDLLINRASGAWVADASGHDEPLVSGGGERDRPC
jgi:hypothetical protein